MDCSANDELAAEALVPFDAQLMDRARVALARVISSSPSPNLHPNALRGLAAGCPLTGRKRQPRSPGKQVLPRVVLCRWTPRTRSEHWFELGEMWLRSRPTL
jgi:hypothetical protein